MSGLDIGALAPAVRSYITSLIGSDPVAYVENGPAIPADKAPGAVQTAGQPPSAPRWVVVFTDRLLLVVRPQNADPDRHGITVTPRRRLAQMELQPVQGVPAGPPPADGAWPADCTLRLNYGEAGPQITLPMNPADHVARKALGDLMASLRNDLVAPL